MLVMTRMHERDEVIQWYVMLHGGKSSVLVLVLSLIKREGVVAHLQLLWINQY